MRYTRKMPYRIRVATALLGSLLLLTAVPSLANNNLADSMNPRSTERVSATVADLTSSPDEQKSVAITIYNVNLGLVRDRRDLALPRGEAALKFGGVAQLINPATVHIKSLSDPN